MKTPQYQQFLDQRQINIIALKYPEEMQSHFIWLAGYVRDKCFGNVDVLEKQIHNLGFNTTGGSIAKILIGRWISNKAGLAHAPIISYPNFRQIVDRLRSMDRASSLMGKVPFIKTSAWQKISDYIDERRAKDAICKFGIILGPTGSQKGACAKHYCIENNHGACSYFEAPFKPSVREFRSTLAKAFGVDYRASDREKAARLKEAINETRTIYIANIQRLYVPNAGWYQEIFNWLQEMQEATDCTVILEGVLEFQSSLQLGKEAGYFEQFEGRCGGDFLILPKYPPADDLFAIGKAFGLAETKSTLALLDAIVRERGRIRRLFHILQKAQRVANVQKEALTLDHIREVYEDTPINVVLENDDSAIVAAPEPHSRNRTALELATR
jgi:hypothetical protein